MLNSRQKDYTSVFVHDVQRSRQEHYSENGVCQKQTGAVHLLAHDLRWHAGLGHQGDMAVALARRASHALFTLCKLGKGTMETWLWHSPPEWQQAWEGDEVPPLPSEIEELHRLCSPDPGSEPAPMEEEEYFQDFQEEAPKAPEVKRDSFNFSNASILPSNLQDVPHSPKPIATSHANNVANTSVIHDELEAVVLEKKGAVLRRALHEEGPIGECSSSGVLTAAQADNVRAEYLIHHSSQSFTPPNRQLGQGNNSTWVSCISAPASNNPNGGSAEGPMQQKDQQQQGAEGEQRGRSMEGGQGRPGGFAYGAWGSGEGMQEGGGRDKGTERAEEQSGDRPLKMQQGPATGGWEWTSP
eukprot:1159226-Pelagomonas_calceolata.AAC.8